MIDFEKLKMAHELAANSEEYYFEGAFGINGDSDYQIFDTNHDSHGFFDNEDSLLEKIRELTQPEPKYKPGETWWYIDDYNEPQCFLINETNKDWSRKDDEWWPTKSALIEAQIKYWSDMREEKPQEPQYHHSRQYADALISGLCAPQIGTTGCQHESDGCRYDTRQLRMEYSPIDKTWDELLEVGCYNKCIKCGEFYR